MKTYNVGKAWFNARTGVYVAYENDTMFMDYTRALKAYGELIAQDGEQKYLDELEDGEYTQTMWSLENKGAKNHE